MPDKADPDRHFVGHRFTAGAVRRIEWTLKRPVDIVLLETGANDGLRALDPDTLKDNLIPHPLARSSVRVLPDRYVAEIFLPAKALNGLALFGLGGSLARAAGRSGSSTVGSSAVM